MTTSFNGIPVPGHYYDYIVKIAAIKQNARDH